MDNLEPRLHALTIDPNAPAKARKRAEALYKRLTTPLSIAVCGPDNAVVEAVSCALPSDTGLLVISDDVASADVAVWCTHSFLPEEIAFWDAAPAVLQDHSLLVGPQTAHIQDMGAQFFRQVCTPQNVVQKLIQRLEMGREADADHAHALLLKHPQPAVDCDNKPETQKTDTVLAYFQMQADILAALEISDTAESCEAVLMLCSETAQHLTELITLEPDKELQNAVYDATDAITLMMIEGDINAASDAVASLIDLKMRFEGQTQNTPVSQF